MPGDRSARLIEAASSIVSWTPSASASVAGVWPTDRLRMAIAAARTERMPIMEALADPEGERVSPWLPLLGEGEGRGEGGRVARPRQRLKARRPRAGSLRVLCGT